MASTADVVVIGSGDSRRDGVPTGEARPARGPGRQVRHFVADLAPRRRPRIDNPRHGSDDEARQPRRRPARRIRGIARTNLDRGTPAGVFSEGIRNEELSDFASAPCRDAVGCRHRDNDVRLNAPAVEELFRRGLVRGVAFGRAAVCPCCELGDIRLCQFWCVAEFAYMRIRKPWRHFFTEHRGLDRLCPGTRAVVCHERHRSDAAGSMAGLTVVLQNRQNIFIEGRDGSGGFIRRSRRRHFCS